MKSIIVLFIIATLTDTPIHAAERNFARAEWTAILSLIARAEMLHQEESRPAQKSRMSAFTGEACLNLVKRLGGGENVQAAATNWTYDAGKASYFIDVDVRWEDAFPAGARYGVRGQLRVSGDGRHCTFTKLWSSQGVKDHAMFASCGSAPLVLPALNVAAK